MKLLGWGGQERPLCYTWAEVRSQPSEELKKSRGVNSKEVETTHHKGENSNINGVLELVGIILLTDIMRRINKYSNWNYIWLSVATIG